MWVWSELEYPVCDLVHEPTLNPLCIVIFCILLVQCLLSVLHPSTFPLDHAIPSSVQSSMYCTGNIMLP